MTAAAFCLTFVMVSMHQVEARTVKIVALGDSLTAGYGLAPGDSFPSKLERALKAKGQDVDVINAGVSGDTSSGGLARLDWSIPDGTDAVIVELGANDALRGIDPKVTRQAMTSIVARLKERKMEVMVAGMLSPPNMGPQFRDAYDAIFTDIAKDQSVVFYPFFLDGIVADAKFSLRDGIHPNAAGVDAVVTRILPKVEELVARVRAKDTGKAS